MQADENINAAQPDEERRMDQNQKELEIEDATEANESDTEAQRLQTEVRTLMRKVPSSVAVVTVASYDSGLLRNVPMGVAVSSLNTVTLDPPTISFNIKEPSKTLDAIRAAKGLFRVHFPAADRGGARLVELFSQGNYEDAYNLRLKDTKVYVPGVGKWDKRATVSGAPQLWNDSVRAAMECSLTHELPVADHVILVAKIDSLENKAAQEPTLLYLDRSYMRPDGTRVTTHVKNPTATEIHNMGGDWSVWNYPLFQGEDERRDYIQHVKSFIKANPQCLAQTGKETLRALETALPLSPSAFGINLDVLVHEYQRESGVRTKLPAALEKPPILSDFYGRLSPLDKTKIIERATALIRADPQFLTLNYRIFQQHLRVSKSSKDLLPSDLLEPLRAAGLAPSFQPRKGTFSTNNRDFTLQYLEQVEHRLLEHIVTIGHKEAMSSSMGDLIESLGEQKTVATYFKKTRDRLQTAAFLELFHPSLIDIAGHLTRAEALVVISRVVEYMNPSNLYVFRKGLNTDSSEILRLVGVHPSITGPSVNSLNVEFLFGKIRHLYFSTRHFRDLEPRIEEMLAPYFTKTVTWESLEERVKSLVRTQPMRAMTWSNNDKLAAMGLDLRATLTVPIATEEQQLSRGLILDTLFAKELKHLYGKASAGVNESIARYLKEQYNFDVAPAPNQSPLDAQTNSSSDEMDAALIANRHVDVRGLRETLVKRHQEHRPRPRQEQAEQSQQDLDEPQGVRIKFHPKHALEYRGISRNPPRSK
jgi:flavin reductase (DIM6/NTAB) family NADH-FMN oxidoreductase RutF